MQKYSLAKLYEVIRSYTQHNRFFVAYSGGVDSHVLLHSLVQLRFKYPEIEISAIHVHHGISVNADFWENFCKQTCGEFNIFCTIKKVSIKEALKEEFEECKEKSSTEAIARKLRYRVFAEVLPKNAVLLTAHQADDQAETVLLQLLRGSGPKGLAAISPHKKFACGELIRPLLQFSRMELLAYAKTNGLRWIEDESNLDLSISRNYVRHKLIPVMNKNWSDSGILKTCGRVAQNCAEASCLMDVLAEQDYSKVKGSVKKTLSIEKLKEFDLYRQRNVIRFWINSLNLPSPSSAKLEKIQKTVLHCRSDANPLVNWNGVEVRRFKNNIYAMPNLPLHNPKIYVQWNNMLQPLTLPSGIGVLYAAPNKNQPVVSSEIVLTVRFRCGGEMIRLKSRGNHLFSLKHLFQEWKVPQWQRDRIPLIYLNEKLIAIVGFVICENELFSSIEIKEC